MFFDAVLPPNKRRKLADELDRHTMSGIDHLSYQSELSHACSAHKEPEEEQRESQERFRKRMEDIFERYAVDFTGIADEINIRTGAVEVDRGHLSMMPDMQREEEDYDYESFTSEEDGIQEDYDADILDLLQTPARSNLAWLEEKHHSMTKPDRLIPTYDSSEEEDKLTLPKPLNHNNGHVDLSTGTEAYIQDMSGTEGDALPGMDGKSQAQEELAEHNVDDDLSMLSGQSDMLRSSPAVSSPRKHITSSLIHSFTAPARPKHEYRIIPHRPRPPMKLQSMETMSPKPRHRLHAISNRLDDLFANRRIPLWSSERKENLPPLEMQQKRETFEYKSELTNLDLAADKNMDRRVNNRLVRNELGFIVCPKPGCSRLFSAYSNYYKHLQTGCRQLRNPPKPIPCPNVGCPKIYLRQKKLDCHLAKTCKYGPDGDLPSRSDLVQTEKWTLPNNVVSQVRRTDHAKASHNTEEPDSVAGVSAWSKGPQRKLVIKIVDSSSVKRPKNIDHDYSSDGPISPSLRRAKNTQSRDRHNRRTLTGSTFLDQSSTLGPLDDVQTRRVVTADASYQVRQDIARNKALEDRSRREKKLARRQKSSRPEAQNLLQRNMEDENDADDESDVGEKIVFKTVDHDQHDNLVSSDSEHDDEGELDAVTPLPIGVEYNGWMDVHKDNDVFSRNHTPSSTLDDDMPHSPQLI